jgi:hypothetical protein
MAGAFVAGPAAFTCGRWSGSALEAWATVALMGEYGLMQVRITYDDGYRVARL